METIQKLLPTEQITEQNQLEAIKRINDILIRLSDKGMDRDLKMLTELGEIKQRLGSLEETTEKGFQELSSDVDTGFERLSGEIRELRDGQQQVIELLQMIAHNTQRD